jgi:hypothetical protein
MCRRQLFVKGTKQTVVKAYVIFVSRASARNRQRNVLEVTTAGLAAALVALVSGHPAVAEVVGGTLIILIAILAGMDLARRVEREHDPGRVLLFDLLLVLVVVVGLVGVGVMAAAIP